MLGFLLLSFQVRAVSEPSRLPTKPITSHLKPFKAVKYKTQLSRQVVTQKPSETVKSSPQGIIQGDCSTKHGKEYIYCKESRGDPTAVNANGCRGLGQACPGSKLPCSDIDYLCQDAWFTSYMVARYQTWANAEAFHRSNNWW